MMGIPRPADWDSVVVKFSEANRATYSDIRAARPDQQKFKELLMQYAKNSKFANCKAQEGYIKSMGLK